MTRGLYSILITFSLLVFLCEVLQTSSSFVRSFSNDKVGHTVKSIPLEQSEEDHSEETDMASSYCVYDALIQQMPLPYFNFMSVAYTRWNPTEPVQFQTEEKIRPPIS